MSCSQGEEHNCECDIATAVISYGVIQADEANLTYTKFEDSYGNRP